MAPGLAVCAVLATVATVCGSFAPVLGASVIAVVLGTAMSCAVPQASRAGPGLALARSRLLQLAVVLLGMQLSLRQVASTGLRSLPVLGSTLLICLVLAHFLGHRLGIEGNLRTLIGVGTGICGASAIAAISPVIRARSADVAYAISTIFLFNVVAVLAFPPLGRALGLSQHAFGLFAGSAVNDTSSVVAAASSYGASATRIAVVVKLTRTLAIIPIALALGAPRGVVTGRGALKHIRQLVPWFLVAFLFAVVANTAGAVPDAAHAPVQHVEGFLVAMALASIGLGTDVAAIRRAGLRPLLLGLLLWVAVSVTSLAVGAIAM